ncbi:hypothetical protein SAMN05421753_12440 [Planctomicrobium piriforme]|uniref:Uncharacterized protein n=1 Tax=Planctomicrobium piriforme TaxID=1576369 RepID=A0A1I3SLN7_9PLAN|nr:hypothetical protein SAMN05421753_12440 [Planctomicrobium piriforme]
MKDLSFRKRMLRSRQNLSRCCGADVATEAAYGAAIAKNSSSISHETPPLPRLRRTSSGWIVSAGEFDKIPNPREIT